MKKRFQFVLMLIPVLMLVNPAQALPILGDLGMIGYGGEGIDTLTATAIPAPALTFVTNPTGDFDTYLNSGDTATVYGFTFNPAANPVANPLWTAGGFSFTLDSIVVSFRDENQIIFDGLGTITGNGFDSTLGSWHMSVGSTSYFNFQSGTTTDVAPVPEPATIFLLGTGLIGIAKLGRKKLLKN